MLLIPPSFWYAPCTPFYVSIFYSNFFGFIFSIVALKMNDQTNDVPHSSIISDNEDINIVESLAKRFKDVPTLDSINDYCLLHIFQKLDIIEAANLAETCKRLKDLANEFVFPKIARHVFIRFVQLSTMKLRDLEKPFEIFGSFVEKLNFTLALPIRPYYIESEIRKILDFCPNLTSLGMREISFTTSDIDILNHVATGLKELKLEECHGITNDWSAALQRFPKLEHITWTGEDKGANFFKNKIVPSLAIGLMNQENVKGIVDHNASIKQLKLIHLSGTWSWRPDYQFITTLIINKLPKLEILEIEDELSDELTNVLSELPHLRSLIVFVDKSVNAFLRKVSDIGNIEELQIDYGTYDIEDDNAPPLVFNKLLSFHWRMPETSELFLNALTKSQMPVIASLYFSFVVWKRDVGLSKLFESKKKTLKSMTLSYFDFDNPDESNVLEDVSKLCSLIVYWIFILKYYFIFLQIKVLDNKVIKVKLITPTTFQGSDTYLYLCSEQNI